MKKIIQLTIILLIILTTNVFAETICNLEEPETTEHDIKLLSFTVEGPEEQEVGESITVTFELENVGTEEIQFSENGAHLIYLDHMDMNIVETTNANEVLAPEEKVTVTKEITLSNPGPLKIWPNYEFLKDEQMLEGPGNWHTCTLFVFPDKSVVEQDVSEEGNSESQKTINEETETKDNTVNQATSEKETTDNVNSNDNTKESSKIRMIAISAAVIIGLVVVVFLLRKP